MSLKSSKDLLSKKILLKNVIFVTLLRIMVKEHYKLNEQRNGKATISTTNRR